MALNKKIEIPAGDTRAVRVRVVDDAGAPVNLEGATIRWLLAVRRSDPIPVLIKDIGTGIVVDDAQAGRFSFRINSEDSELPAGEYFHQARAMFPDGSISTLFAHYLTILEIV